MLAGKMTSEYIDKDMAINGFRYEAHGLSKEAAEAVIAALDAYMNYLRNLPVANLIEIGPVERLEDANNG